MDFVSTTILIALSTGFVLVTALFGAHQVYNHVYTNHQLVPHMSFYTYQLIVMLLTFVLGVLMLIGPVVNDYWAGITTPGLFIDLVYIISNRRVYLREQLLFFVVHHLITLGLIIILTVTLKIGFMSVSIIPWCLLWNSCSIYFSIYGIWATRHRMISPEIKYHKLYSRHLIVMVAENLSRLAIYPLLFTFNLDHLPPAGLGLGLALILHSFELFAEIKILLDLKGRI